MTWEVSDGEEAQDSAEFEASDRPAVAEPGATIETVGGVLGVSRETIRKWRLRRTSRRIPRCAGRASSTPSSSPCGVGCRVLEEEREILAKAAAFLARETGRTR